MAASNSRTEAPAGQSRFPPFQTQYYPSQIVWLVLTFSLLYVLMAKLALPRINAIIADRAKRISDDLAAAQRLKQQSEAARTGYESALADARARAQQIANATREREAAAAEASNKRLEAELHERLAASEASIAKTRSAAMTNVGTIAAETAAAIVERLIGKAPAAHDVAAAVADPHNS
ncbi:MAG: F0F1 ATP synthase subunit B' [Xanthobacteraceae bacterium]